jgi:hypothetical protein
MFTEIQLKVYGRHLPEATQDMPETTFQGDDGTQVISLPQCSVNVATVLADLFGRGFGIELIGKKLQGTRNQEEGKKPRKVTVVVLKPGLVDRAEIPSLSGLTAKSLYIWVNPTGVVTINVARWDPQESPEEELRFDGAEFVVR